MEEPILVRHDKETAEIGAGVANATGVMNTVGETSIAGTGGMTKIGGDEAEQAGGLMTIQAIHKEMMKVLKETQDGQATIFYLLGEVQKQCEEVTMMQQQLIEGSTTRAIVLIAPVSIPVAIVATSLTGELTPSHKDVASQHSPGVQHGIGFIGNIMGSIYATITLTVPTTGNYIPNSMVPPMSVLPQQMDGNRLITKVDMIEAINELRKQPSVPVELDFTPPYPFYIRQLPYPQGYIEHPPQFPKYDGKKGNAREHVAHFIESMSMWLTGDSLSNEKLLLRGFNKTLTHNRPVNDSNQIRS